MLLCKYSNGWLPCGFEREVSFHEEQDSQERLELSLVNWIATTQVFNQWAEPKQTSFQNPFFFPCPSSCPCLFLISAKTRQNQQATFLATKAFILMFEISLHACRHSVSEQGQAAISQGFYRLTGFPDSWATMLSFAHTSRKHIFTSSLAVPQFCAARGRAASCAMDAHWLQESKVSVSLFCWPLDAHTPTVTPGHGMTQKWAQPGHWQAQRRGGHRRGRNKSCQPFPNTRLKNKFAELC